MTVTAIRGEAGSRRFAFRPMRMRGKLVPYALITPALVCLLTFNVLSIAVAAAVSLTNLNISGLADHSQVRFVGLANYRAMFVDPAFWEALRNPLFFVALGAPTLGVRSPAIAISPNHSKPRFFRALPSFYFLPGITAT